MPSHIDYWKDQIRKDLSPFCDPGTELEIIDDSRVILASWISRNQSKEAQFTVSLDGPIEVSYLSRKMNYKSFFASPEMADLSGLAKMMLQAQPPRLYIPTKARLLDVPASKQKDALELIRDEVGKEYRDSSLVIIIVGDAGSGKTMVLRELVRAQASAYIFNKTNQLFFYVNAQGRALARFSEALATELQDLRANLTYHAVATLVRLGLIVPVIDGFDELLGVSGYDEAFSSLSLFIEELEGEGVLVASARSTYYEEEFRARTTSLSSFGGQYWTQVPIRISAWSDEEFYEFASKRILQEKLSEKKKNKLIADMEKVFSEKNSYLKIKPLFVARVLDLLIQEEDLSGDADLIEELVEIYLERERKEKLLNKSGTDIINKDQMRILFSTIAEEMWNQETRELDRASLRWIAEYVLGNEGVEEETVRIIIKRMPNMAFLMPGNRKESIAFEHELFFTYFLAGAFAREILRKNGGIRMLLGRSILPPEMGDTVLAELRKRKALLAEDEVIKVLNILSEAANYDRQRAAMTKENAGHVVANILRYLSENISQTKPFELTSIIFPGNDLTSITLRNVRFVDIEFRRSDLRGAKILSSSSRGVLINDIIIDPQTRLEIGEVDRDFRVYGLRFADKGRLSTVYDPVKIIAILSSCGAGTPVSIKKRKISDEYLNLMDKMIRAYRRTNPICTDDDQLRALFGHTKWQRLESLLIKNEIIKKERRDASGRPKEFLRRNVLPEQLMTGIRYDADVPKNIYDFWMELEQVSKK